MVQQLYNDVEQLKARVAQLRGRLDAFSVGGQVISGSITGGVQLPLPIEGAMLYGTSAPAWGRLAPPVTAGDNYKLNFLDGDTIPSWQIDAGAGDDVFTIAMASAL